MSYFLGNFPATRLRRTRSAPWIRKLTAESALTVDDLILPIFVRDPDKPHEIANFPDVFRYTINELPAVLEHAAKLGIQAVALFPYTPENLRSDDAKEALNPENLLCRAIRQVKYHVPHMGIIADIALDLYTTYAHDGLVLNGAVDNDETVALLCRQSLNAAEAGATVIAPSDMMDGRIGAIRRVLDQHGFQDRLILSYSAKYDSNFYGPYREAVGTGTRLKSNNPKELTDKKTYQLSTSNSEEALREAAQDITEGADILMVKPALPYLDIIQRYSQEYPAVPVFGFQVTGEYALLKSYPDYEQGQKMLVESLLSMKRAGAKAMLTYGAIEVAELLNNGEGYSQ